MFDLKLPEPRNHPHLSRCFCLSICLFKFNIEQKNFHFQKPKSAVLNITLVQIKITIFNSRKTSDKRITNEIIKKKLDVLSSNSLSLGLQLLLTIKQEVTLI